MPFLFVDRFDFINIRNVCFLFIAFCLTSSAVYIMNDLFDIKNDKKHFQKMNRPIAQGKINKNNALILMFGFLLLGVVLAGIHNIYCFYILLCYFILNIFYSLYLKNLAIIDIISISFGFVLRILSGYAMVKISPSLFIILLVFCTAFLFTLIKRKYEFVLLGACARKSLQKYDIRLINKFININIIVIIFIHIMFMKKYLFSQDLMLFIALISIIINILIMFRLKKLSDKMIWQCDFISCIVKDKKLFVLFILCLITLIYA